jgi:hypothetical protein
MHRAVEPPELYDQIQASDAAGHWLVNCQRGSDPPPLAPSPGGAPSISLEPNFGFFCV